jgi:hypothetical protein
VKKRPFWRDRRILEDNIKMDLKEIVWDGVDSINITQNRNK